MVAAETWPSTIITDKCHKNKAFLLMKLAVLIQEDTPNGIPNETLSETTDCRIGRWSFWSWFDVLLLAKMWAENNFYIFVPSDLDLWPLLVQRYFFIKLEVLSAFLLRGGRGRRRMGGQTDGRGAMLNATPRSLEGHHNKKLPAWHFDVVSCIESVLYPSYTWARDYDLQSPQPDMVEVIFITFSILNLFLSSCRMKKNCSFFIIQFLIFLKNDFWFGE